ncbi:MAG TPA: VWA domain-containing protein [Bryobacteraceae bacterium]|nr:VWA domain-containing protein [Bryobacteraceae bacterium]
MSGSCDVSRKNCPGARIALGRRRMPIDLVSQLVSAAVGAFGLALVASVGLFLFRIRSSAARHATWTVVLVGMLLQIPLGTVALTVPLKALPILLHHSQPRVTGPARASSPAAQMAASADHARSERMGRRVSPAEVFTGLYVAASMLLFLRMAFGFWGLHRILRDARPVPSLGPGIFESTLFVAPASVGCFRARILLPRAWRSWDAGKLRAVLAHERAHIRRRDWLIQVASHVNVCIFWFHPLAWWIERELARLAEEACDDVALSEMEDGEEYAATLVDIARAAATDGGLLNWRMISMAKESNVTRRVNRILDRTRRIPKPFGRLAWITLFACGLPLIYLSAAVKLASAQEQRSSAGLIVQAAPHQILTPAPPPIALCILIDNSGSMRDKRAGVRVAALALVKASRPHDEVCMMDFNDEVFNGLLHGKDFTSDIKEMEEALTYIESRGGTAMRDAIRASIDHMEQRAHNDRKVIVLLTEGNDTSSTVTQEQLLGKLKNSSIRIYSIGLPGEDDAGRFALRQLVQASGGRDYYPKDLAQVESISSEIANKMRTR